MDINKDGILDIVLGNEYEFKPQFSRLDTNYVVCYLEIKMELIHGLYSKSGFFIKGEVKHLQLIKDKIIQFHCAVINESTPKIFKNNE
jgi:hypothetical protein